MTIKSDIYVALGHIENCINKVKEDYNRKLEDAVYGGKSTLFPKEEQLIDSLEQISVKLQTIISEE